MKKYLRKITSLITISAVLCSFVITPAMAATKLTPYHLYRWANTNNYSRLHQFKRYINLQDDNQNTALCLAQQAKDRHAYTTLLKFGASTEVECHDDDDPICAIIAKEKYKLSPAWLLIGAGAAALLLDNGGSGSDSTPKVCNINQYPYLNECPTGMKQVNECQDDTGLHLTCACDESQNHYEDQSICKTNAQGNIGYDCSTKDTNGCYIRTTLTCASPQKETCEQAIEGFILNDQKTNNFAGETECHSCTYTCDTNRNYVESCPAGYS